MLTNTWFSSSHHRESYYLGRQLEAIEVQLLKQRPPLEFSRPPRSIQKHLKYWKTSELRSWVLYYSLPILRHSLPREYWHHYALLVCALHIFLGEELSQQDIDAAEQMLRDFCTLLPISMDNVAVQQMLTCYFILESMSESGGRCGPIQCFGYESKNGQIKRFIHNKFDVVKQLLFNVDVNVTLQQLMPILETNGDSTNIGLPS